MSESLSWVDASVQSSIAGAVGFVIIFVVSLLTLELQPKWGAFLWIIPIDLLFVMIFTSDASMRSFSYYSMILVLLLSLWAIPFWATMTYTSWNRYACFFLALVPFLVCALPTLFFT